MAIRIQIGDEVRVVGEIESFFHGEVGVVRGVEVARSGDKESNLYWVYFTGEENRLIGRYLQAVNP